MAVSAVRPGEEGGGNAGSVAPIRKKKKRLPILGKPPSKDDLALSRSKAAEAMKLGTFPPEDGESLLTGPNASLAVMFDPSAHPGGTMSPDNIGIGAGPSGAAAMAGAGLSKLLTPKMVKALPASGKRKAVSDIPDSLMAKAKTRVRKLFKNKGLDDLEPDEAHTLFDDVVDNLDYQPVKAVRTERREVKEGAKAKTATAARSTTRQEDSANVTRSITKDKDAAQAVGSPAVNVSEGAVRTGGRREVRGEGSPLKGASADAANREARGVSEDLKGVVTGQATPKKAAPSMYGEMITEEEVKAVNQGALTRARKGETRTQRGKVKAADKEGRRITAAAKELEVTDVGAARVELAILNSRVSKIKGTASQETIDANQSAITKLENKIDNLEKQNLKPIKAARAAKDQENLDRAARSKAALKDSSPKDPRAAQESFARWQKLTPKDRNNVQRRAEQIGEKSFEKMNADERMAFIARAMSNRKQGMIAGGQRRAQQTAQNRAAADGTPQKESRIETRRRELREEEAGKLANQKPATETVEGVAEEVTQAAPRASGRERLEKRAKQGAGATLSGLAGGAAGGYVGGPVGAQVGAMLAPPVIEAAKRAPITTGVALAGVGGAHLYNTADERREAEMLEAANSRVRTARKVNKGKKKLADSTAATKAERLADLNKNQWHGPKIKFDEDGNPQSFPNNWIEAYHKVQNAAVEAIRAGLANNDPFYKGAEIDDEYEKINDMEEGALQNEAMAKHFRDTIGYALEQGYADTFSVEYDEDGNPADLDIPMIINAIFGNKNK